MNLIYEGEWNSYEEWGGLRIYEKDGEYFVQEGGFCVLADPPTSEWGPIYKVSFESAYREMVEFENYLENHTM